MAEVTLQLVNAEITQLFARLREASIITDFHMKQLLRGQRDRILERTARGVDFEERPFVPYSERGPFYYYGGRSSSHLAYRKGVATKVLKATKKAGVKTSSGLGVKYPSYGVFKRALDGGGVNLRGPVGPHMLDQIEIRTNEMGIYDGEKAAIAEGHNEGLGRLPQRRFFDVSESDQLKLQEHLASIVEKRMEAAVR